MTDNREDEFSEEERITQNLRLGSDSIPAANRTLLGFFAFIPSKWRGPIALFAIATIGYLLGSGTPYVASWIKKLGADHASQSK